MFTIAATSWIVISASKRAGSGVTWSVVECS